MRIAFGSDKLEVRPWGSEGKILVMTRDPAMEMQIITAIYELPEHFEYLAGEYNVEDMADLMMVVVKADKIGLFAYQEGMDSACVLRISDVPDEPEEA